MSKERLDKYIEGMMARPEVKRMLIRGCRDIALFGEITPETAKARDELLDALYYDR